MDSSFITGLFKLMSDKTRLRIIALLQDEELAVGELQSILRISQSNVSSQLGLLRDNRLVLTRKEGQKVYYRLPHDIETNNDYKLISDTLKEIRNSEWMEPEMRRLKDVINTRAESSKYFFNSLKSEDFSPPGQTWETLARGLVNILDVRNVIDLGCGTGIISIMLYNSGKRVTGVDSSEERIKTARSHLKKIRIEPPPPLASIDFKCAYMEKTGLESASAELVLISQSLHHVASPPSVIKEAHRLLCEGGKLLILDLLSHQNDWMRDKFGDFWLGFSRDNIRQWLEQCGFQKISIQVSLDAGTKEDLNTLIISATR